MPHLLVTNDDGVDSPALVPFARALMERHEVTVVAPDGERSWSGKAISRHEPITLVTTDREGLEVHATSGTPADATQLGLHVVTAGAASVVVSGINIGFNHGVAFLLSSGTVGAAVEGWISGRPAVAFSTGIWGGDWETWRRAVTGHDSATQWTTMAALCADLLDEVLDSGLADRADLVTINLPWGADASTPRRVTDLARVGYGRLFHPVEDGRWQHRGVDLQPFGGLVGTDLEGADDQVVTVTPVRMPATPDVPPEVRRRIERL